ncbi:hypothetical protein P2318_33390 [Myxococcaceae bacterium GXIMD 01537]
MSLSSSVASYTRRGLLGAAVALAGFAAPAHAAGNPMAYVGEQHNSILACIIENDPVGFEDPFYIIIDICLFNAGVPSAEFSKAYSPLIPRNPLAPLAEQIAPAREAFSDAQYAYISKIESILSTQSPEQAAKSLDALETQAVRSLKRGEADLAVLSGLATARSSLKFWTAGDGTGTPPPQAAKAKWWQVVLGDVAGGIVGGIFGGGVGAVGLGTACSAAVANLKD